VWERPESVAKKKIMKIADALELLQLKPDCPQRSINPAYKKAVNLVQSSKNTPVSAKLASLETLSQVKNFFFFFFF
jgi:hypothetical protein